MKKKLLLLGGSRYLLPVIEEAHKLGCHVITCDYLPNNIAHKYSDEYHNVSVVDKGAVLDLAVKLQIDGIMSFACDPGVTAAAYVAEKMGLPFQGSYESVSILQDKGRFRKFLWDNNFNSPHAGCYAEKEEALKDVGNFIFPVIIKPVDSAGSKGVTRVDNMEDTSKLMAAIDEALDKSISKRFVIEDFLTFEGYHSSSDCFVVDGELKFYTYSDHLFDKKAANPFVPSAVIWPSTMKREHQDYLTSEIQRLMKCLKMGTGIYNIETCVGSDGKPYIMEVSPRGGGCKIAEIQNLSFGMNLIEAEVKKAIREPVGEIIQSACDGVWCEMGIHSNSEIAGKFKELWIETSIKEKYIKGIDLQVKEGDIVESFTEANKSLGEMFLRFDTREELNRVMEASEKWMKVILE